jgi:hypothetical protein
MEAIVTVKLDKPVTKTQMMKDAAKVLDVPVIDVTEKKTGPCPLLAHHSHFVHITCTDVEGAHHSYLEYGESIEKIREKAQMKFGHVTRIETQSRFIKPCFQELYQASMYDVYTDIIEDFFHGKNHFQDAKPWMVGGKEISKGFIWIARHVGFETLTVEPKDGGQYEIAVRMPHAADDQHFYTHSGYSINDWGTFSGFDTSGH